MTTDTLTLEDAIERLDILASALALQSKRIEVLERIATAAFVQVAGMNFDPTYGLRLPDVLGDDGKPTSTLNMRAIRMQVNRDVARILERQAIHDAE